jgi:hypothetical protein
MSLDAGLLKGATAAIALAGIDGACGREEQASAHVESAIRMLRCALENDQAHRDLVHRLVNDTEPRLSHEYDFRGRDNA